MKGVVISVLVVIALVQFMMVKPGEATISCKQVSDLVAPCVPYLITGIGSPSTGCCDGLGKLQKLATTTADKQQACNCAKNAAALLPAVNEKAAASLPAKCNIQISIPISKDINCQDIH